MAKEENLDQLLAEQKEYDDKQAKLRDRIKASAIEEAASIRDKVNKISSLSGITKFELLGISKEEAIKHFNIRQRAENKQAKKPPTADDITIRDYLKANPTKKFNREGGKTYTYQKGPVPNDVRQMILAEVSGLAPE